MPARMLAFKCREGKQKHEVAHDVRKEEGNVSRRGKSKVSFSLETTESRVRGKAPDNRNEREFTTDQLGLIMTECAAL